MGTLSAVSLFLSIATLGNQANAVSQVVPVEPKATEAARVNAAEQPTKGSVDVNKDDSQAAKSATAFKTIEWIQLLPAEDLEALLNPPDYIGAIPEGSLEDDVSRQVQSAMEDAFGENFDDPFSDQFGGAADDSYQQALQSVKVVEEMNDQAIRLPGFVVPLAYNDVQAVTHFFLVPYFGACIHMPPPPPNQIIFVKYAEGLILENLNTPLWISGVLETSLIENGVATAAYRMDMASHEIYDE